MSLALLMCLIKWQYKYLKGVCQVFEPNSWHSFEAICLNQALKQKRSKWDNRYDKLILLSNNTRPRCKTSQKILGRSEVRNSVPFAVFTGHCSFRFLFVPVHASSAVGFFRRAIQFL